MTRFPRTEVRLVCVIVGLLPIAGLFASYAFGQSRTTSALAGRVEDPNGLPIPTAHVEASSEELIGGVRVATTDSQGRFRFSEIPPGEATPESTSHNKRSFVTKNLLHGIPFDSVLFFIIWNSPRYKLRFYSTTR